MNARRRQTRRMVTSTICLGLLISGLVSAGETDPTLLLYSGQRFDANAGTALRLHGSFPWNATLQSGYPIEVVIWPTDGIGEFLRVRFDGSVRSGSAAFVVDGLTPGEASILSQEGSLSQAHSLTHVGRGRLDLDLAPPFVGRPLAAQLIVIDEGTPFVSNAIAIAEVP